VSGFLQVGQREATPSALSIHARQYMCPHLCAGIEDVRGETERGGGLSVVFTHGVMVSCVMVSKQITHGSSAERDT
jgi:hypothetical protein